MTAMLRKLKYAVAAPLIVLGAFIVVPWARNGMMSLANDVGDSAAIQLHDKGCSDLGINDVRASSVWFDPIGPGPFKATDMRKRVHRFVCPDGSQHDLPAD